MNELHDAIPRALQDLPQWVLYRIQKRNGHTTKIPYQATRATRRASSTDPGTWSTFQAAYDAHQHGRGAGIGFVFTPEDPYVGIDLDACLRAGVLHPQAQAIITQLNTYTETSPSGIGLHAIGEGDVGGGRRTGNTPWGGELEIYDRARYFTVTGNRFDGAPTHIADVDEALAALMAELLPDLTPPSNGNGNGHAPARTLAALDDRDLIDRAFTAANGLKFQALWQGDTGAYTSQSEAELALCAMLAFWTGPDEQRIDWLFRQSALVRPKWEQREEYRAATITKALAGRTEFYGQPAPAPRPLRAVTTPEDALQVASAAIKMDETPLIAAAERRGGRIVLERADELRMTAPNLGALATYAKLAGELAAQFGHELVVPKDEKTATAHRFVAALRRHLGPGQIDALEQRFEGWLVELANAASEITFTGGDAGSRLRAWRALDEADPEAERGAHAFAKKVLLAHDLNTGDRYLRASWAQEYVRRCGWRGGLEEAVGLLEAIGLERPNRDGRVRAQWRAGGETLVLRFWAIPGVRFEQWRADS